MDWQKVIEAARAEAQRQGATLDVLSHSERPDRHYVLMTLEAPQRPPALGVHVKETVATEDKLR